MSLRPQPPQDLTVSESKQCFYGYKNFVWHVQNIRWYLPIITKKKIDLFLTSFVLRY